MAFKNMLLLIWIIFVITEISIVSTTSNVNELVVYKCEYPADAQYCLKNVHTVNVGGDFNNTVCSNFQQFLRDDYKCDNQQTATENILANQTLENSTLVSLPKENSTTNCTLFINNTKITDRLICYEESRGFVLINISTTTTDDVLEKVSTTDTFVFIPVDEITTIKSEETDNNKIESTPDSIKNSENSSLGLIVGLCILFAIIAVLLFFFYYYYKARQQKSSATQNNIAKSQDYNGVELTEMKGMIEASDSSDKAEDLQLPENQPIQQQTEDASGSQEIQDSVTIDTSDRKSIPL